MSPEQAQTQSPQTGQPIREGQLDEDKGQDADQRDEPQNQGHPIGEGDAIPGGTEEVRTPDEISEQGLDVGQPKSNAANPASNAK